MSSANKLEYASDSDDLKSVGPDQDEDSDLYVDEPDFDNFVVEKGDIGFDMHAKNNLASEIHKRNKGLHATKFSDKVVEIAADPSDDDSINSDAESKDDFGLSDGELELLSSERVHKPSTSNKITLDVEGGGDQDGEGEIVESGAEEDDDECMEKCSGDEKSGSDDELIEGGSNDQGEVCDESCNEEEDQNEEEEDGECVEEC